MSEVKSTLDHGVVRFQIRVLERQNNIKEMVSLSLHKDRRNHVHV